MELPFTLPSASPSDILVPVQVHPGTRHDCRRGSSGRPLPRRAIPIFPPWHTRNNNFIFFTSSLLHPADPAFIAITLTSPAGNALTGLDSAKEPPAPHAPPATEQELGTSLSHAAARHLPPSTSNNDDLCGAPRDCTAKAVAVPLFRLCTPGITGSIWARSGSLA